MLMIEDKNRPNKCPHCNNRSIRRHQSIRIRHNGKITRKQRYICNNCLRTMWGKE